MLTIKLRHVLEDTDRHGNVRVYFRKRGQRMVRMRDPIGSPEFMAQYQKLMSGEIEAPPVAQISRPLPGTWRALCVGYFASSQFRRLDDYTQARRRGVLEGTFIEPLAPESKDHFGEMPVQRFGSKAVRVLRDRKIEFPEAANMRLKAIRQVFKWAIDDEVSGVKNNPARDVDYFRSATDGFHSWTIEEVEQYETYHPVGTRARLALALMMYLGVRRSDVVLLGRQHVRDGWLNFTATKGRKRSPTRLSLPILSELQEIIDATECGHLAFLVTEFGKPFTANGFGNRFKKWCVEAGLPHCSAHGLRKAGAVIAAENGATDHQLMAIFGWKTIKEAQRYTKAARQKILAGSGMPLLRRAKREQK